MGKLSVLDDEKKLRKLGDVVYNQEVLHTQNIKFKSEEHRVEYLRDCKQNHDDIMDLIDEAKAWLDKFLDDDDKKTIAHQVYTYTVRCINAALQTVRNYSVRKTYVTKIKAHAAELMKKVDELDPLNVDEVEQLSKEATGYKESMDKYLDKYQSGLSKKFSSWLKAKGMTYEQLVERYQAELGLKGEFENLEEQEKIRVYNKIIEVSGRGRIVEEVVDVAFGVAGAAVLVFSLGTMVWDVFTAERPVKTAMKDSVLAVAQLGGAAIGEVVEAAAAVAADEVEASAVFVTMVGFISSMVGAFVIAAIGAVIIDLIFGSGGKKPPQLTEGHHVYVAPLPDGASIAHVLASAADIDDVDRLLLEANLIILPSTDQPTVEQLQI